MARRGDRRPRPAPVLKGIRDASAAPGMRAIAWGIAYPDIWRAFAPYLVGLVPNGRYFDRAWSAETAWERAWTQNIRAAATPMRAGTLCSPAERSKSMS